MVRKVGPNDGNSRPPSKPDRLQDNRGCKNPISGKVLPPDKKPETPPNRPDGTTAGIVNPRRPRKGYYIAAALVLVSLGVAALRSYNKNKAKKEQVDNKQ